MTLEEILKAKGLNDDDVKSVIGEMKQNKIFTTSEENLDIRYSKLKTDHDNLTKQHGESTALIEQMKKDNAGNEALQGKITEYETKIANNARDSASVDRLTSAIQTEISSQGGIISNLLNSILQVVTKLDDELGERLYQAMTGLKLQVNEREFARLVKEV